MYKKYIFSCSCGNYLYANGGTNKVIRAHQKMLYEQELSYVFIFPVRKQIGKLTAYGWGLNIDRRFAGLFSARGIVAKLYELQKQECECIQIHIHHLLKANIRELIKITDLFDCSMKFYLHDYYSVCKQGNLLLNGERFCKAQNGLCSKKECRYCDETYVTQNLAFFKHNRHRLEFIAPSESVKRQWASLSGAPLDKIRVVLHQTLKGEYKENKEDTDTEIRIAFPGTQTANKGWNEWKTIVARTDNPKIRFYYFGIGTERLKNVENISVSFQRDGDDAMTRALRKYKIHAVYLGSIWPETYAYTYYEAYAANCYVLTNSVSGNVACAVSQNQNGKVFEKTEEIIEYLNRESGLQKDLRDWYSRGQYGPMELEENRYLLKMVKGGEKNAKQISGSRRFPRRKIVLELFYRFRKMR